MSNINFSLLLPEDAIDIQQYQENIEILKQELEQIRLTPYDQKDPTDVRSHTALYDGKKQELQTAQRDLSAFARNARKEYTNWIASNVQTVVTANSQSTSKSKVPTGPTNINTKEMKLSEPKRFSGKMSQYRMWRFECQNFISTRDSINTDDRKIKFMGSRMEDMALEWYESYSLERDRLLAITTPDTNELNRRNQEFRDFLSRLDETFKDPIELTNNRNADVAEGDKAAGSG
ncbi:hypothetical protein SeMB42_g07696 [Synchytrium endobioticum]|uniref:Retrotransposon gag domain-containing protein n=1 Tax=Synchytrium endobioticum TaxID=286115 RepID=A0A507CIU4_9FUNG|nr:hypothetical protein SeMB42_g07696 [Synchytrium endobioticum]TPX39478.1 hypothetical protein SeLEV6574_g07175 [Synchytrium endobioticum]